uniref:IS110 family transposase n=1 Tax=Burkholderia ubonensis TaxID=101571 RepID=UPI002ABD7725|nr:IS110 family transposase [Burkholderia ubonensis]
MVLEATGNTTAIVKVLCRHVARVAIANSLPIRLIAEARVKTDKIDAAVLAQLYASGFLPEVWMPDERTQALRRQIARRSQLVRQRTRSKNEIHAGLIAHLIERCPATDLFGKKGRAWFGVQPLPLDERLGVEQRLRELDGLGDDLREVEQALAPATIDDARLRVMLMITGVNTTVAIGLLSAIGDIARFPNPEKLVSYFGLNPSVYQSDPAPARHGHITKRGPSYARAILVERRVLSAKPIAVEYRLTEHGRSLTEIVEEIRAWSVRTLAQTLKARARYDAIHAGYEEAEGVLHRCR